MKVHLALRKNDTRIGAKLIQWWTGSIYSHCELVVDGVCYSSSIMDKGVRAKVIELEPDKWDVIDLPWVRAADVLAYFKATDSYTYGWFSLVASQLFNRNQADNDSQFCSEWCAAAIGVKDPSMYSPSALYKLAQYIVETTPLLEFDSQSTHIGWP